MEKKTVFNGKNLSRTLRFSRDGIWYATKQDKVSYPSKGNNRCFEIEDKSFWFQHRNACIVELVKRFPPRGNGPIFDVGGGNGFVAKGLVEAGWDVVLVEPGSAGARNAKKRGLQHVICATTQAAGFKLESMPAVGVFDVVEHIEDDLGFLRHLHELLEPEGLLYLTVPALSFLWSKADVLAGHYRRYTKKELIHKLKTAGFEVCLATYLFCFLPIIVFFLRSLPFRFGLESAAVDPEKTNFTHGTQNSYFARAMQCFLSQEKSFIAQGCDIKIGSSCLVAARKIP